MSSSWDEFKCNLSYGSLQAEASFLLRILDNPACIERTKLRKKQKCFKGLYDRERIYELYSFHASCSNSNDALLGESALFAFTKTVNYYEQKTEDRGTVR